MFKKIYPLIFLLILTACSSDDDAGNDEPQEELPVTVENLVGTWMAVSEKKTDAALEEAIDENFKKIDESDSFTYTFNLDSTFALSNDNRDCQGGFQIDEKEKRSLTIMATCPSIGNDEISARIISLTSNNLILAFSGEDTISQTKFEKKENQEITN